MAAEMTTYRYLRFALLALLLALAVSVAAETIRAGWQTSISGYYYTAAGPVFIGVLCAVGVCLVALRGATDAEDVCLNLAGISAPMVAFVPTPERGHSPDEHAIVNNALTYLAVLGVGYVVVLLAGLRHRARGVAWPSPWGVLGLLSVLGAWVVGVVWILWSRASFAAHAHTLAAVFTFLPFIGVVVLNTDWGARVLARAPRSWTRFDKAYWAIFAGFVLVGALFGALWACAYALLGLEVGILLLFGLFWGLQTLDLFAQERDAARQAPATGLSGEM